VAVEAAARLNVASSANAVLRVLVDMGGSPEAGGIGSNDWLVNGLVMAIRKSKRGAKSRQRLGHAWAQMLTGKQPARSRSGRPSVGKGRGLADT
jgi:hypothetical protein